MWRTHNGLPKRLGWGAERWPFQIRQSQSSLAPTDSEVRRTASRLLI
ncbi:hypothetical protein RB7613 [Rhodopirellula baltica SH 1]|uniref:Uncharacterized protein n=1 Tax=Rhodopirellula baltica (strain DSM 10527 / NCIMB 13988 / SH1) TaxID=243090 RepID=Q7UNF3_RHOBA|nr:hypothetical protein RB7613 [Rhodopirellula baltica SH 1]